jgi:hypothetical protein
VSITSPVIEYTRIISRSPEIRLGVGHVGAPSWLMESWTVAELHELALTNGEAGDTFHARRVLQRLAGGDIGFAEAVTMLRRISSRTGVCDSTDIGTRRVHEDEIRGLA